MLKTGQYTLWAVLFVVTVFVLSAFLSLGSCDNGLWEAPEQETRLVAVSFASGEGGARTAMPQHAARYYYTLLASAPGKTMVYRDLGEKTSVELALAPALWQFTVRGYLSSGKAEGPVLFGSGELDTAAGHSLAITLNAGATANGVLAFSFGLPSGVFSARMTIAPPEGSPIPLDLLAGNHLSAPGTGTLDRPSGVYRLAVDLRNKAGKAALWNSVAHISDAFETPVAFVFPENPFTSFARFGSIAALAAWLSDAAPNTADNPYPLDLEGINVKSDNLSPNELGYSKTDGLGNLYAAFQGRYVALDMDACTGASIPFSSFNAAQGRTRPDQDKLVCLILPRTIRTVGGNSFTNCVNLKSVIFPDSLQLIRQESFAGCTSLETLEFPASLTWIENSFRGCTSLKTIVCHAPTPPDILYSWREFGGAPLEAIYVPADSVDAYKAAYGWKDYAAIIKPIVPEDT
jgi:hypothetical protein